MPEYIDKDKLLNAIECIDISNCTDVDDIFIEIERTIDEQPTADVTEVRHGRWIDCSNGWMCSECEHDNTYDKPYCPNCGAKNGRKGVDKK